MIGTARLQQLPGVAAGAGPLGAPEGAGGVDHVKARVLAPHVQHRADHADPALALRLRARRACAHGSRWERKIAANVHTKMNHFHSEPAAPSPDRPTVGEDQRHLAFLRTYS